jgi:threonine dehydratase
VLQPVTSFKLRGVFHAVASLDDAVRRRGISTVSAGNTAQALAWCGRHFGVAARSIMPETAPRTKVDAVRALGGTPVLVPREEVFRYMRERLWQDEPYAYVCPWTDPRVHAGHGTIGLEIVDDAPDVETVFVPVGGGGLLCGVGSALAALRPEVRIVAVEPAGCPAFHASLEAGRPVSVECETICDGVAVPYMTDEMFPLLQGLVDDAVLVPEPAVRDAIRRLALERKLVVEGAGALAFAAALATPECERGRSVCLLTGGSLDPAVLAEVLGARS